MYPPAEPQTINTDDEGYSIKTCINSTALDFQHSKYLRPNNWVEHDEIGRKYPPYFDWQQKQLVHCSKLKVHKCSVLEKTGENWARSSVPIFPIIIWDQVKWSPLLVASSLKNQILKPNGTNSAPSQPAADQRSCSNRLLESENNISTSPLQYYNPKQSRYQFEVLQSWNVFLVLPPCWEQCGQKEKERGLKMSKWQTSLCSWCIRRLLWWWRFCNRS